MKKYALTGLAVVGLVCASNRLEATNFLIDNAFGSMLNISLSGTNSRGEKVSKTLSVRAGYVKQVDDYFECIDGISRNGKGIVEFGTSEPWTGSICKDATIVFHNVLVYKGLFKKDQREMRVEVTNQ